MTLWAPPRLRESRRRSPQGHFVAKQRRQLLVVAKLNLHHYCISFVQDCETCLKFLVCSSPAISSRFTDSETGRFLTKVLSISRRSGCVGS